MKRSEINRVYRQARDFFIKNNWNWHASAPWDITDVGSGDFNKVGATLINLATEDEYCEKLLYSFQVQQIPMHCHKQKKEDIIARVGTIALTLYPRHPSECKNGEEFNVKVNGQLSKQKAGCPIVLNAGERVTINRGIYHNIKTVSTECIIGEVSTANNDVDDNYFVDATMSRFSDIIEDEPAEIILVNE